MLRAGDRAPDFTLPDQTGTPTSLGSLLRSGPLVLFFYPGDFTPICTREASMIRDAHADLATAGIGVAGISPDAPAVHAEFKERHALPYPLLSDGDRRVIAAYGVAGPLGLVRRATFLIDADGLIVDAVRADLRVGRHAALIARAAAERSAD
jgi:thioredoxin-dependent peroxiredoxin